MKLFTLFSQYTSNDICVKESLNEALMNDDRKERKDLVNVHNPS